MKSITTAVQLPSIRFIILSFVLALSVVAILALPHAASAHQTSAQSAVQLTDDTFMFTIDFRFGVLNRDVALPLLAARMPSVVEDMAALQYQLVDSNGEVVEGGQTSSIVIGDESLVSDYQYVLPANNPSQFTLLSIVKLTPAQVTAGGDLSMKLNYLPYFLEDDGEYGLASIPTSLLGDHQTPFVSWKPTAASETHTLSIPISSTWK